LSALEVVSADEGGELGGELDAAGDKGVLRAAVDERRTFQDAGDGKDSGGRDFRVAGCDGCQKICGGVIDSWDDVGVSLSVGSPLNDDLVEAVVLLERPVDVS